MPRSATQFVPVAAAPDPRRRLALGLVLVSLVLGCAERAATPVAAPVRSATAAPVTHPALEAKMRAVDFRNRRYGMYTLRDGKAELREYEEMGGRHDSNEWRLRAVTYVDLTGDGVPEALVQVDMERWTADGRGSSGSELHLFGVSPTSGDLVAIGEIDSWSIVIVGIETSGAELFLTLAAADGKCVEHWVVAAGAVRPAGEPGVCKPLKGAAPGAP